MGGFTKRVHWPPQVGKGTRSPTIPNETGERTGKSRTALCPHVCEKHSSEEKGGPQELTGVTSSSVRIRMKWGPRGRNHMVAPGGEKVKRIVRCSNSEGDTAGAPISPKEGKETVVYRDGAPDATQRTSGYRTLLGATLGKAWAAT